MHETFDSLQAMIRPVLGTDAGEPVDWARAHEEWGPLPTDYIDFVNCFGAGNLDHEVWILAPLRVESDGPVSLSEDAPDAVQLERLHCPFPAFPEPGGLLCWGGGAGGDLAFWRTGDKDPDNWTTVLFRRHVAPEWRQYPCGMTELLLKSVRREWDSCPFSSTSLWGKDSMEFLSFHSDRQRFRDGIDPWSGEADSTWI